jgi:hypothetical protein
MSFSGFIYCISFTVTVYFRGVAFAAMSGQATLLETSAGIMTHSLKIMWFDALLRQDLAYYDIKDISGAASIISQNGARYKKYVC